MELTPFSRDRFFPSDDPAVLEAVKNIAGKLGLDKHISEFNPDEQADQQAMRERTALEEMARAHDSKTKKEGSISRIVEGMFRRGFANPDKLKTKPKDIIAMLVGQEIARRSFHGTSDFISPQGKQALAEIEQTVLGLLPKSEPEARAIIDCMRRFDVVIFEAIKNDDEAHAPELWQAVQDYYTHVDKALSAPKEKESAEEAAERKGHIEQSGIQSLSIGLWTGPSDEFEQVLQRREEHDRAASKAALTQGQKPPKKSKLKDFYEPKLAIPNERFGKTLRLLHGQLMGRVHELLDPSDPDVEENQRKFVEMFEHLPLLNRRAKYDIPVHPDWLSAPGIENKIMGFLYNQDARGIEPSILNALWLGVVKPNTMPEEFRERALTRAVSQTDRGNSSFEQLAHALSGKKKPFPSYRDVAESPRVKEETIRAMRTMLEGGASLSEWLSGIAQFDAFVKSRALEPLAALSITPGDPVAEATKEIFFTIPAELTSLQQERDALNKQVDAKEKELKGLKIDRLIKKTEKELDELDDKIAEINKEIAALSKKCGPAAREALFSPYRRLSKAELTDTIKKTLNVQLTRLVNTFKNGHDKDFVKLREELLKERGGDTYWQYHVLQDSDLLYDTFVGYIDGTAVARLQNLASQPEKQKATRKFFVDNNIVSDAMLRSKGV